LSNVKKAAISPHEYIPTKNEHMNDINKTKDMPTNEGASEDENTSDIEKTEDTSTKEVTVLFMKPKVQRKKRTQTCQQV
ncbi:Hypothetical predicted protein, partial [Paramuricea clavata]